MGFDSSKTGENSVKSANHLDLKVLFLPKIFPKL